MFEEGPAQPEIKTETRELLERLRRHRDAILAQVRRAIVGQDEAVSLVMLSLLVGGHSLITGMPGMAKTMLVRNVARALGLSFRRIQFTPDLMPSDIIGTEILREDRASGERQFVFVRGPLFANIVLADEINRTPPKTQAALLEAMQEHRVTAAGKEHVLAEPFLVLATQNPIEQEGTYPLPEAQLDRFMFHVKVDYPSYDEEIEVVRRTTVHRDHKVEKVLSGQDIIALQDLVYCIPVPDHVYKYAVTLARMTRKDDPESPSYIRDWVAWGAGPRASQYLILGAKARSILSGRGYASVEDVKAVAAPVLRHRILLTFNAEAEGMTSDGVVRKLLAEVPAIQEK